MGFSSSNIYALEYFSPVYINSYICTNLGNRVGDFVSILTFVRFFTAH